MTQLISEITPPFLDSNGAIVRNDTATPNTRLRVTPGQAQDTTNKVYMNLGNYLGQTTGTIDPNSNTIIDATTVGVNGLDGGVLEANEIYSIYMIADSSKRNVTACLLSKSASGPILPGGYDSLRQMGFWATDSSAHFVTGTTFGNSNSRRFYYKTPVPTAITTGNATSYTAVSLNNIVPVPLETFMLTTFTPSAPGRSVFLQGGTSTSDEIINIGQATGVPMNTYFNIAPNNVAGVPTINYKVSDSSDSVAISVCGFIFYV